MNPITLVFGSFVLYTAVKGQLSSFWALATTKNAAGKTPTNTVAAQTGVSTGAANATPSPTSLGTAIAQSLEQNAAQNAQNYGQ